MIRKDNTVVIAISDLTDSQAQKMIKEIMRLKSRYASNANGTIVYGRKEEIKVIIKNEDEYIEAR